jgi:DsbC/DsbD-like thiol-disulfide interchange protein
MMKYLLIIMVAIVFTGEKAKAQIEHPVEWSYAAKHIRNHQAILMFRAKIQAGWHIYSTKQEPGGPQATKININPATSFQVIGSLTEPTPIKKYVDVFEMNTLFFENEVVFQQRVSLKNQGQHIRGTISYMACNDKKCLPGENLNFEILIK